MVLTLFPVGYRKFVFPCAIGLSALLLSSCNSDPEPITAQTSKYEVAGDDSPTTEAAAEPNRTSLEPGTATEQPRAPAGSSPNDPATTRRSDRGSSAAESAGSGTSIPKKPSATPPAELTSKSRSNDPEAILVRIGELQASLNPNQIRGSTQEERITNVVNIIREIDRLSELVLTSKAPGKQQIVAAQAKFQSLMMLDELQQPQAAEDLKMFVATMTRSEIDELKRFGRNITFAMAVDTYTTSRNGDAAKLLKEFKSLFADESKDEALMTLSRRVAVIFIRANKKDEAKTVMTMIQEAFQNSTDATLAEQAKTLAVEIKMLDLDINAKFEAFMKNEPDSEQPLMDVLQQLFADKEMAKQSIPLALQIAQNVEATQFDSVGQIYDLLKAAITADPQTELIKEVQTALEDYEKRKALIGKPIDVVGATLKGEPFDWSKYQGKVVLIDLWATWCEPCLRELPNVKENYDRYHDQGFEVVGVNLDDDRRSVDGFFSLQKLPWTTIVSADPNKVGFEHPLAVHCNVKAIPFLLLVGRDGNVITLNARGSLLGKKLAELFPEKPKEK